MTNTQKKVYELAATIYSTTHNPHDTYTLRRVWFTTHEGTRGWWAEIVTAFGNKMVWLGHNLAEVQAEVESRRS